MVRLVLRLVLVTMLVASPAMAQDVNIRFGQSLRLDNSPLEVTADQLDVDQATGATVFTGNVLAVQGAMRITAGVLSLTYESGAQPGSQRIGQLRAAGGVTMVTEAEAIESREAVYSMSAQTLEMTGDVVLVQGSNMLSGERFVADLRSGSGQMIGRVRTIIRLE